MDAPLKVYDKKVKKMKFYICSVKMKLSLVTL